MNLLVIFTGPSDAGCALEIQSHNTVFYNSVRSQFLDEDSWTDGLIGGISTLVPFVQYLYFAPKQSFPMGNRAAVRKALYLFAFSKVFTQFSESRTGAFIRDSLPAASDVKAGALFSY